ncbi:alpha/beta hydrolase family protein [Halococcus salifodinae]|nr:alpha/beta fold hydrolase [Halococcus salifodinae]
MDDLSEEKRNAREFATRFIDRRFTDATSMLADDGHEAIIDSFPDFLTEEGMDPENVLEQYWWGLHGQYGEAKAVDELTVHDDTEVTVMFAFENGTQTATLGLKGDSISEFSFTLAYEPPSYADEDAFIEHEVTIDAEDVTLNGLLTAPEDRNPVPGVVLVHGAGVHDPDGTVDNSKILKDIAWRLATKGIASLRYEKRLANNEVPDNALTLDAVVTDDAVAAVDRLATVDDVHEDALFIAGHSQGGMCAPRIADRHGGVAGVVNLDGSPNPNLNPEHADIIRYEFEIDGDLDEEQAAQLEEDRETLRRIAEGEFDDDETIMGRPGVWHRSLGEYDPVSTASSLNVPMLALMTFSADEETQPELAAFSRNRYETWRDADLPEGSRAECYMNVDHYFQSVTPPTTPLSLYFGGNVAENVIDDLNEWIQGVST